MKEKKLVKGVYLKKSVVEEVEVMAKEEQRTVSNMLTLIINNFFREKNNDTIEKEK